MTRSLLETSQAPAAARSARPNFSLQRVKNVTKGMSKVRVAAAFQERLEKVAYWDRTAVADTEHRLLANVEIPDGLAAEIADGAVNPEAALIYKLLVLGVSFGVTGPAGCGKTFTLSKAVAYYEARSEFVTGQLVKTATSHAGKRTFDATQTLHGFLGCQLFDKPVTTHVTDAQKNSALNQRLTTVQTLAISESGQRGAVFYDKMSTFFERVRNVPSQFGGVQLAMDYDVLQLGEVPEDGERSSCMLAAKSLQHLRHIVYVCSSSPLSST